MKLPGNLTALVASLVIVSYGLAGEWTVLSPSADGATPGQRWERWQQQEFVKLVEQRSAAFEQALKSEAACREWQASRRAFFLDRIGGLPERTPLNPLLVGKLPGRGYSVEKLILETRPGFHLTANLYLPATPPPWPGVLVPCGHSHDGKAVGQYQLVCRLLARHGLAAICYDPIGQGERYQVLDANGGHSHFEDAPHVATPHDHVRLLCTTEHTLIGLSSALLGDNVAQFRIWDGMRVIDYLQSRPDIMADKIGCTGNSGGGTETAYLMALDDRIRAAAPGCFLTTFRRLIETKGPQDGEQNIFGQIAFGFDQADYCILRVPRPTLICAGTRDATFDFQGTWDLFRDAKRFASRLGVSDRVDIAAPDAPHGFTLQLREAATRFMVRHLLGCDVEVREIEQLPDSFTDDELRNLTQPDWTAAQLQCTPSGQVLHLADERSAFQLNAQQARQLRTARQSAWGQRSADERRQLVRDVIGWELPADPAVASAGVVERSAGPVHKLILTLAPGVELPALAFVPKQPNGQATLYLHDTSASADAELGGPIDALVAQGQLVLAAEVRGIGEVETGHTRRAFGAGRFGRDGLEVFTAYLMGQSFVGLRAHDIAAWTRYLGQSSLAGGPPKSIHLVARGKVAIPALHAAALEPQRYATVTLRRMIPHWESLVAASESFDQPSNIVHGVLRHYDLPDLIDLLGPDRVVLQEPVDVLGQPLP